MPFQVLVEGRQEASDCLVSYWSSAEDVQTAVAQTLLWIPLDRRLVEARLVRLSWQGCADPPPGYHPTAEDGLFESATRIFWERDPELPTFVFPSGVIPADEPGPFDPEEIAEGWIEWRRNDLCGAEAVIDGRRLAEVFELCLQRIAAMSGGMEVRLIAESAEQSATEVWRIDESPLGADFSVFLQLHQTHLLDNGLVELAYRAPALELMLKLTHHKTIQCVSPQRSALEIIMRLWTELGLPQQEPLLALGDDIAHFHYRPLNALAHDELKVMLQRAGFALAEQW